MCMVVLPLLSFVLASERASGRASEIVRIIHTSSSSSSIGLVYYYYSFYFYKPSQAAQLLLLAPGLGGTFS